MGRFNNLPEEIMLEILSRLPTESVLDCKLVCKSWNNLVRHPCFSGLHLNHHLDSGKLSFIFLSCQQEFKEFCYSEYDENCQEAPFNRKTRINLAPPLKDYYFAGSSNGLICFNAWNEGYHYGPAYICNPITREYLILPTTKVNYWWTGFGYVLSTNEYKVVRIYNSGADSNVGIVQVYILGSGNGWRNGGTLDVNMKHVKKGSGKCANGAIHWEHNEGTIILIFHLVDEKFSELPSPPSCLTRAGDPYSVITLGVLGDFLSAHYYHSKAGGCEIWYLKKNRDSHNELRWHKVFSFNRYVPPPFACTKSDRLLYYWVGDGTGKIYSYGANDSSARMDASFDKFISEATPHKNTLVSLKILGEKDTRTMESGEGVGSSN